MSREIVLDDYAFLVSETDEKGIINFANDDFCRISGYDLEELIIKTNELGEYQYVIRKSRKL